MMLLEIIKPAGKNVTLQLPEEIVGKTVEVIAFEIDEEKLIPTKLERLRQI